MTWIDSQLIIGLNFTQANAHNGLTITPGATATNAVTLQTNGTGGISALSSLYLKGNPTLPLEAVPMQWVTANFAPLSGGGYVQKIGDVMSGGLGFGGALAATSVDISRHLNLYEGGPTNRFGFNVSFDGVNAHLNYVITEPGHSYHTFVVGSANAASIGNGALWMGAGFDISLSRDPTQPMHAVPLQYLPNNFLTTAQGDLRWVNVGGDTMSGNLTLDTTSNAILTLKGPGLPALVFENTSDTNTAGYFLSKRKGLSRWSVEFGSSGGEAGGNQGTDFLMNRFSDTGEVLSPSPLAISRQTGTVTIATPLMLGGDPTTGLQAVPRQYLDNNFMTTAQGDLRWVNVGGDTMTGVLTIDALGSALTLRNQTGWPTLVFRRHDRRNGGGVYPGHAQRRAALVNGTGCWSGGKRRGHRKPVQPSTVR